MAVAIRLVLVVFVALGCSLDRGATSEGNSGEEGCRTGSRKKCVCASGDEGVQVCADGTYGPCTSCGSLPTAGTGAPADGGATAGQGEPGGSGGTAENGGTGGVDAAGTGGESDGIGGEDGGGSGAAGGAGENGGSGAVGGAGESGGSGGVGGAAGAPSIFIDKCPPPLTCQMSIYVLGYPFCAEPAGMTGPIPPLCSDSADCEVIGLTGVPCIDSGLGLAACIVLCPLGS